MAYEAWEREHDNKMFAAIQSAKFEEAEGDCGDLVITFAHMRGEVTTMDGTMYWSVFGGPSGEKYFGQSEADGRNAIRYGRAAVRNEIARAMDKVIARITERRAEV